MRIALRLEYDGTDFHGSQLQLVDRTVQGELEKALEALFKARLRPRFASRTDAGVHAKDQVAAFDIASTLDMDTVRSALNHHLPNDIAVRSARRVADGFDPRRDAVAREYVYTIDNGAVVSPIGRRFQAHVPQPLDASRMDSACRWLEGMRDFAAFAGSAAPRGASTLRRMDAASSCRRGRRVVVTFRANAFLNQQVRKMAAALVSVGRGAMSEAQFRVLVDGAQRGAAKGVMPSRGLCLTRVEYPETGVGALPA